MHFALQSFQWGLKIQQSSKIQLMRIVTKRLSTWECHCTPTHSCMQHCNGRQLSTAVYRLHLMHIMEVSMVCNGLAVVSVFLLLSRNYSNSLWVAYSKYYKRLSRTARARSRLCFRYRRNHRLMHKTAYSDKYLPWALENLCWTVWFVWERYGVGAIARIQ